MTSKKNIPVSCGAPPHLFRGEGSPVAGQDGPQVERCDGLQGVYRSVGVVIIGGTWKMGAVPPADQGISCQQYPVAQQPDLAMRVAGKGKHLPAVHLFARIDGM